MDLPPVSLRPIEGSVAAADLRGRLDALVARSSVPVEFPAQVQDAARAAASSWREGAALPDRTDIAFVTLDPAGSTDLDQAMHLERDGQGYRVLYAIADVPRFVELGGPIDTEARRRGQTVYLPDRRLSLHPEVLSEGAASLLPGQDAPAFVWSFALDAEGAVTETRLERAVVRSRSQLAYDAVQKDIDAGTPHPMMALLLEIGRLRQALEAQRGGASLTLPEQEVVADGDALRLTWRAPLAIEDANAQLSLMTGMAAAQVMLDGGAGILRTMPPADPRAITDLRQAAAALGRPWPADMPYGEFLRGLRWSEPHDLALLNRAASLFRGASYRAFTDQTDAPAGAEAVQSAIGAPYAHTTAPLRRLVDRFVLLTCCHLLAGDPLPDDLRAALPLIPQIMHETGSRSGALERAAIDLVEVLALRAVVGQELEATVLSGHDGNALLQLNDPPVSIRARVPGAIGDVIRVRVAAVDVEAGTVRFEPAGAAPSPSSGPSSAR